MTRHLRLFLTVCLLAFALLSVGFMTLQPELPDDRAQWLTTIADARAAASAAAQMFLWSQLPFAVSVVGLVAWLRPRFPRLTIIGGVFGVLGAFGHTVAGSWTLTQIVMADEPTHRDAYSQLIAAQEQSALIVPFLVIGVVGTVVGILLLSIAHFRSRVHPRWVGPVLWVWLVVEFVGSGISPWATYLSGLLLLAGCGGLAAGLFATRQDDHAGLVAAA